MGTKYTMPIGPDGKRHKVYPPLQVSQEEVDEMNKLGDTVALPKGEAKVSFGVPKSQESVTENGSEDLAEESYPAVERARKELELVENQCMDKSELIMQKSMTKNIMELIQVFAKQNHMFSTEYALNIFAKLVKWLPLTPLTGAEDEWSEPYIVGGDNTQQNKRCPFIFRDNFDNATAINIEGKIFSEDGGLTWYSGSRSSIRITFPYCVPDHPEQVYLNSEDKNHAPKKVQHPKRKWWMLIVGLVFGLAFIGLAMLFAFILLELIG